MMTGNFGILHKILIHLSCLLVSLSTLLILNRPLFRRAILMSGDATLRKPRRISWHDRMYNENIKILGLESISPLQRVHVLRNMAAEDLVAQLPIAQHWCAVVDGELLATEVDLGVLGDPQNPLAKPEWCEQIIVGDTMHDVSTDSSQSIPNDD